MRYHIEELIRFDDLDLVFKVIPIMIEIVTLDWFGTDFFAESTATFIYIFINLLMSFLMNI